MKPAGQSLIPKLTTITMTRRSRYSPEPAEVTTGRQCRTTQSQDWCTYRRPRPAAERTRSIQTSLMFRAGRIPDCFEVIAAVARLRYSQHPRIQRRRCLLSARLRRKANEECSLPGIQSLKRNGGGRLAAAGSAGGRGENGGELVLEGLMTGRVWGGHATKT